MTKAATKRALIAKLRSLEGDDLRFACILVDVVRNVGPRDDKHGWHFTVSALMGEIACELPWMLSRAAKAAEVQW